MPRYAFRIEYDGRPFAGWQRQDGPDSVQQRLEEALRALEPDVPSIAAAGRTDAGVHATGQVAHADMTKQWSPFRLSEAVNWHLKPAPVAITACARVSDDWHARFSAGERRYTFRIIARRAPLALDAGQAWRVIGPLDVDAMRAGAAHLVGHHDFTTFRASICQAKSPVKTMAEITLEERPYPAGQDVRMHLRARSFLHNQVRSIAGTLERVGAGSWPPDRVRAALKACDRAHCGPVAPPDGLTLTGVGYADDPFGGSR
ncbi:tRNA pseudouridine(38-40) synthase TruA [Jannaschia donghaensis]|uniref:tRNA pseudouridine synthase A n=1 Tax=Jannaschia donghaensis TaxID=420998 RepID=A0A0M6YHM3_9RHOB|nr:tRNA pseudouridine(38-40) synthase TruA [Jannaschia donghaensis]CTQ49851.1 tRNA pseudouridine synthase A [Jannaschia donghaensis]